MGDQSPTGARKEMRLNNNKPYVDLTKAVTTGRIFALTSLMADILVYCWMIFPS